ncbi:ROK family protein [Arthrobacter sp. NPDC090010]|uniref:ROK family transcriptional regulator n=1 Tax=Arthrobacter sp. NPDC090010 TaxID=3363942 RepID=UPI0037FAFCDD
MELRRGDTTRLRRQNAVLTMRLLREHGAMGLTDLAAQSGLSRPTVEGIVDDFLGSGWLAAKEPEAGQVGRPRRLVEFRASSGYIMGVDIGSVTVRAVVADLSGEAVGGASGPVGPGDPPAARLAAARRVAAHAVKDAGLGPEALSAVCIATTGTVSPRGVVTHSVALPGWAGTDLAGEWGAVYDCPVVVENDCNLAAMAEAWQGVAAGFSEVAYIHCGMRTGAGLFINGRLYRGARGLSGEIGALPLVGWHRAPERLAAFSGLEPGMPGEAVAATVFEAAKGGNVEARWAVERYASDLAEGIAALVLTLDPELVVLGGGVSRSGDILLEPLARYLEPLCIEAPSLSLSALGERAVVAGAVRHALNLVEEQLYDVDRALPDPLPL